jgi:hypothetical protein
MQTRETYGEMDVEIVPRFHGSGHVWRHIGIQMMIKRWAVPDCQQISNLP